MLFGSCHLILYTPFRATPTWKQQLSKRGFLYSIHNHNIKFDFRFCLSTKISTGTRHTVLILLRSQNNHTLHTLKSCPSSPDSLYCQQRSVWIDSLKIFSEKRNAKTIQRTPCTWKVSIDWIFPVTESGFRHIVEISVEASHLLTKFPKNWCDDISDT